MISLTAKQAKLLAFIKSYMAENKGLAPSTEEIRVGCGLASKSGVCRMLDGLEERRAIRRLKHRARGVEVLSDPTPPKPTVPDDFAARLASLSDEKLGLVASMVDDERRRRMIAAILNDQAGRPGKSGAAA